MALNSAIHILKGEIARAKAANPCRKIIASVCIVSENGGKGKSLSQKMINTSLVPAGNKSNKSTIAMICERNGQMYWRNMDVKERQKFSNIPGIKVYEYKGAEWEGTNS